MAKPTGLGYPGGLGPVTFIEYARTTYGVPVTYEEAKALRMLWLATYPEAEEYLNEWVPSQALTGVQIKNTKKGTMEQAHAYKTPLGMVRGRATYCSTANGFGLQSPSSECTKMGLHEVTEECWIRPGSVLYGDRMVNYVHDELMLEIKDQGAATNTEKASLVERHMQEQMSRITPDVRVSTEPALMLRWSKSAEPKYNSKKQLIPYDG